jgi:XRE family aerobic/anaerobic benzoate catabolism transcriptional regulator
MSSSLNPESVLAQVPPAQEGDFLHLLGKRVRAARNLRSLTRRTLARDAGVSERHLAQLESGEGNVSVVLLRRITTALGISLADLFAAEPSANTPRNRIALVGLRGAGKSTLGARLASELSVPFIELDREIERDTGMPLAEIFSLYGQSGYRAIEKRTMERVVKQHDRAVFSIGGGVVSEKETYEYLLSHCYTVWIKAQPQEHMSRVIAQGDFRAMAGNDRAMEDLRRILEEREPLYRKAKLVIDTSGATVEESFTKLKAEIETIRKL